MHSLSHAQAGRRSRQPVLRGAGRGQGATRLYRMLYGRSLVGSSNSPHVGTCAFARAGARQRRRRDAANGGRHEP
jgi:hypothetical protein